MAEERPSPVIGPVYDPPKHWWQDWRWMAAIALCVVGIGILGLAASQYMTADVTTQTAEVTGDTKVTVDQLKVIADQNADVLRQLARNQAGIDELVAFVHQVQQQAAQTGGDTQAAVDRILHVLCSSSDPDRVRACTILGIPSVQTTGG